MNTGPDRDVIRRPTTSPEAARLPYPLIGVSFQRRSIEGQRLPINATTLSPVPRPRQVVPVEQGVSRRIYVERVLARGPT
jgi:hypothetical protein